MEYTSSAWCAVVSSSPLGQMVWTQGQEPGIPAVLISFWNCLCILDESTNLTASRIITWKMWKKFLLSNFLHEAMVRINYFTEGLSGSLARSPKMATTDFLQFLINFPKLHTLCMHIFLYWFFGFLINKTHLRIFLALTSRGTTMEKLLSYCKDPAQNIAETLSWGGTARRHRLVADSPFGQTLAHVQHLLHHILCFLLLDTTNSALTFARECYLLTAPLWYHQQVSCLTKLRN